MSKLVYLFLSFSIGQTINLSNFIFTITYGIIFITIFVLGIIHLLKYNEKTESYFIFLYLTILILPTITLLNAPHYMMNAFVPFSIILSSGLVAIKNKFISNTLRGGILIIYCLSIFNLYTGKYFQRMEFIDDWKYIAKFISLQAKNEDIIFSSSQSLKYYYKKLNGKGIFIDSIEDIKNIKVVKNKIYFVYTPLSGAFPEKDAKEKSALKSLLKNKKLTSKIGFSKDESASFKRRVAGRSFPEYRIELFILE